MMTKRPKVPISERALIQRINRKLKPEDQMLRTTRGERWRSSQGNHYIIDFNRNWMVADHVDVEDLGRELGVLAEWEHVVEDVATR
jgi:hypothetical protein